MGFINRTIAVFSPRLAARRAAEDYRRALFERASARGYDGAARTKRTKDWNPSQKNANETLGPAALVLRARAYDLIRNNPHAAAIASRHADNLVGTGFSVKFKTGDTAVDQRLAKKWTTFAKAKNFDPAGEMSFDARTHQAAYNMVAGGEIYARRRARRLSDGYPVPFQVQFLEADMVDWGKNSDQSQRTNNVVIQGIEFDLIGRRHGYWMFRESPSAATAVFSSAGNSVFVPAEEVVHLYEPRRDQVHGETWLAPVMKRLRDLDDYQEAEILRKKTEACFVGVITPAEDSEDDENPNIGLPSRETVDPETGELLDHEDWGLTDSEGDVVDRVEPAMIYQAKPGSEVKFNTPATSAGYDTYKRAELRDVAAGARMPYEVMTGDLSEVSFASGRMGTLEYRRFIESVQWNIIVPKWCDPIAAWFIQAMRALGEIREDLEVEVEWTAPAFQSITPIDDANTDLTEIRAGLASWDEKVRARGFDPDKVAAEIAARNKFFDENGIVLDSDPRHVSKNGQRHQNADASGAEGDANAPGEQDREARTGYGKVQPLRSLRR